MLAVSALLSALLLLLCAPFTSPFAITSITRATTRAFRPPSPVHRGSKTSLFSSVYHNANARGLATTPTECAPLADDPFTLYMMPSTLPNADGSDETSPGACPFAHYVRSVLFFKNLKYKLRPTSTENKPNWLVEYYEGSMPALKHGSEAYVESSVISQYLDFFFESPTLGEDKKLRAAESSFFPALKKFVMCTDAAQDDDLKSDLLTALAELEAALPTSPGPTLTDLSLAPQLYYMTVALDAFKQDSLSTAAVFELHPTLKTYADALFKLPSFKHALDYSDEVIIAGFEMGRANTSP